MHGLTRMTTGTALHGDWHLPSWWYSSEVITLAWPCTHLKAGNHTTTLQENMDGFVICKSGLIMTHRCNIYSQAYPSILPHSALDRQADGMPTMWIVKSVNAIHFYFTLEVQCHKTMLLLSYNKM